MARDPLGDEAFDVQASLLFASFQDQELGDEDLGEEAVRPLKPGDEDPVSNLAVTVNIHRRCLSPGARKANPLSSCTCWHLFKLSPLRSALVCMQALCRLSPSYRDNPQPCAARYH
jgi:hypothetical protein